MRQWIFNFLFALTDSLISNALPKKECPISSSSKGTLMKVDPSCELVFLVRFVGGDTEDVWFSDWIALEKETVVETNFAVFMVFSLLPVISLSTCISISTKECSSCYFCSLGHTITNQTSLLWVK